VNQPKKERALYVLASNMPLFSVAAALREFFAEEPPGRAFT
jgi:hypothetical protein